MDDSSRAVVPCPRCVKPMKVISVRAGYGYEHKVEICKPCSLIYFEGPETYSLPASASAVLLQHFRGKQPPGHEAPTTFYCPRCNVAMKDIALKLPNHTYHQRQCEECKAVAITSTEYQKSLDMKDLQEAAKDNEQARTERRWPSHCVSCGGPYASAYVMACGFCGAPRELIFDEGSG